MNSVPLLVALCLLSRAARAEEFDFDHDGRPERLIATPEGVRIQRRDAGEWKPADLALPPEVDAAPDRDTGLRFLDVNGDGFDDVVFSTPDRHAVYLWNTEVKAGLGWTAGWPHLVREGRREGTPHEPPVLLGASARVENGELIAVRPEGTARIRLRDLLAFTPPPPRSPAEALAAFRPRPGVIVELVACEPAVVDPVAFDWDARGRLWVVEMRDYPLGLDGRGQPGGVVKVLEDRDGDGVLEHAETFLEGLPFPTGLAHWGDGVLVCAAPDLILARDTDGDDHADERRVLFSGFQPGNQQHRFNGLERGLDGWLHLANGDSGGTVTATATGRRLDIRGRDLRVHPDSGAMETLSAASQFGRRRDDWDRWFGNNNPTWLWQVTVPEHYLARNPGLGVKAVKLGLAGGDTRVFPAGTPAPRLNQPWGLNHVTSACSPCPYRDDLFGPDFATSVFVSEPVHNVVHREVLRTEGSVLASGRAGDERDREFLASLDPWFRPTSLRVGPDGALYIADMQRYVLEHPEWIPKAQQARMDLRAGENMGRIWRVRPAGAPRRAIPSLAGRSPAELVGFLQSSNGWVRDMAAHRLTRQPESVPQEALRRALSPTSPPATRVQILALLGELKALRVQDVAPLLRDPHPGVRIQALRQAEALAPALAREVAAALRDALPEVRVQAAFSLGAWPPEMAEPALAVEAHLAGEDPLFRIALLSALRQDSPLGKRLAQSETVPPPPPPKPLPASSPDRAKVIAGYAHLAALKPDPARGRVHFQTLCAPCHRLRGEGTEVGPDLDMVSGKDVAWLMDAILDPDRTVEARYLPWKAVRADGTEAAGLLAAETANNITLRMPGGAEVLVLRSGLRSLEPLKHSLMPAGFENALKPQDLADLLGWLGRQP